MCLWTMVFSQKCIQAKCARNGWTVNSIVMTPMKIVWILGEVMLCYNLEYNVILFRMKNYNQTIFLFPLIYYVRMWNDSFQFKTVKKKKKKNQNSQTIVQRLRGLQCNNIIGSERNCSYGVKIFRIFEERNKMWQSLGVMALFSVHHHCARICALKMW